jgi:hypothetical protein
MPVRGTSILAGTSLCILSITNFVFQNRIKIRLRDVAPLSSLLIEDIVLFPCSIRRCVSLLQIGISPHIAGIGHPSMIQHASITHDAG